MVDITAGAILRIIRETPPFTGAHVLYPSPSGSPLGGSCKRRFEQQNV